MAKEDCGVEHFPAGLRVLVVDDDAACLAILEKMLRRCLYQVTTCCRATIALSLLREKKSAFDLVISDVHMPDMDGFKLLEHVGLEMDLPVIMMSADGTTSAVMRGIKHGACDYLIKPVRIEELKNIWQHVIRKKWSGSKENENSGSMEDADRQKKGIEDIERASSVNDGADSSWKPQKKKRDAKEDDDDGELENDDSSASKKPRVVWSVELHQQFVNAVNQLGIDKAVPKRILELMNVPGLTRENVASHLQKFRLYLKRLNVVTQQQSGLYNPYSGSSETNAKIGALGRGDFQALAASGQIPPQTLAAALHAEYLGCSSGNVVLPLVDQTTLLQTSVPGSKYTPIEQRSIGFGQPLVKCQASVTKQFTQNNIILENASGFSDWSPNNFAPACSTVNLSGLNNIQSNVLGQILPQKQSQPVLSNSSQAVNVQPSCLIAPSQPSNIYHIGSNSNLGNTNTMLLPAQSSNPFQAGVRPDPLKQSCSYGNCNTIANYSHVSSQTSNASLCMGQASHGQLKNAGLLNGSLVPCASGTASSFPSGLAPFDANSDWRVSNSVESNPNSTGLSAANMWDIQNSGGNSILQPDPLQAKHHGFVGKDTRIPSRFAVEDIDCPVGDLTHKRMALGDDASRVKQEIQLDFLEGSTGGNIGLPHFSSNDFMGVISK